MKSIKLTVLSACASCAFAIASFAGGVINELPSEYFDALNAKLLNSGYSAIRIIDETHFKFAAYDSVGSEVILVAHPSNYQIVSSSYVHIGDN